MKILNQHNILASIGALLIAVAACTPEPEGQPTPEPPTPEPPTPEPPVEEVEQRMVTIVKFTYEDEVYTDTETYYFNYDSEDRVNKITHHYEYFEDGDEYSDIGWALSIDYMSQDFIQLMYHEDGGEIDREYAYLNENGYIESFIDEEYTYDLSGYLHKVSYTDGEYHANATYRWRNGNLSSVDETWGDDEVYMYAFHYNTNSRGLINIDLADFICYQCDLLGSTPLSWIGLRGESSENYVTSITEQSDYGKYVYTLKWSYDNDGYPKICRINQQHIDETGALHCTDDYLMEISYFDETGEVTPPQPVVKEEPIVLRVYDDELNGGSEVEIELDEVVYFVVTKDGEDITSQCDIRNLTTNEYIDPSYCFLTSAGTYIFVAENEGITSNQVMVTVTEPENSLPSNISKWIGTYSASTYQEMVFNGEDDPYLRYGTQNFTITIEYQSDRELFNVCGLSSILDSGYGILAQLDEDNNLLIKDTYFIDDDEDDGLEHRWLFCYDMYYDPNNLYNKFTYYLYPSELKLKMDAQGHVTFEAEDIIINDGDAMGSFVMTDIFYVDHNENTLSHVANEYPIIYRAGAFDIRKISDEVASTRAESFPKANICKSHNQSNCTDKPFEMADILSL